MRIEQMPDNKLRLTLSGFASENGHVRFSDLVKELSSLETALVELDRGSSNRRRQTVYYRVTEISHNSPAVFELEEVPVSAEIVPNAPILALAKILGGINSFEAMAEVDSSVLTSIASMARPVGKTVAAATIQTNGFVFELDRRVPARVQEILRPVEEYGSSAAGMLEAINIHNGANQFTLYPDVGAKRIACHFPKDLLPRALEGIGRFVEISGEFRKRRAARFPFAASVTALEVLPDDSEIPDVINLEGIAPEMTGGLSAADYLEKIRSSWPA